MPTFVYKARDATGKPVKGTMEAADVLYGVTMEEAGMSKLIGMRLRDPAESEREVRITHQEVESPGEGSQDSEAEASAEEAA